MRDRITGLITMAVLVGCWSASPALATSLVRLSLEQMTQASTDIVRGRVVAQETHWNAQHTEILTDTTLAVEEIAKGQPPSTVVVEQLGGTIGHLRVLVAGTVHFRPQISYLLFLEPAGENSSRYLVVGMAQGAYRIYQDATTHEERVIQPLADVFYSGAVRPSTGTTPLPQFQQQLTAALHAPVAIPTGTLLAVEIESTRSRGVGRLALDGRTTSDVFPSPTLVIPAGSRVEGTAERVAGIWKIRWTDVSIRHRRVPIAASSEAPAGVSLSGTFLVVRVR